MRRFLPFLFGCLSIFCFPRFVYAADVVINEYFPNPEGSSETSEWIELFNNTDSEIDLTGWKIDDVAEGGSSAYSISSGSLITAKGFFILERSVTGIILNNDSDEIRLLNTTDQVIDEYDYSETEENVFYGRKTDGGSEWVEFSTSTKNSSNNSGTIIPTSTTAPDPTAEPTNTSVPTKVPTFTPLPTYTKVPTKKTTTTIAKSPTPKKPSPTKVIEKKVLGDTSDKEPTESPKKDDVKVKGNSGLNPGTIFISIGGIFLVACGILLFYMKKKAQKLL